MPGRELPRYSPTPDEIREQYRKIRRGWDVKTEQRRREYDAADWECPVYSVRILLSNAREFDKCE